jgi:hypothetical protein
MEKKTLMENTDSLKYLQLRAESAIMLRVDLMNIVSLYAYLTA